MLKRSVVPAILIALSVVAIGRAQALPGERTITYGVFRNGDRIGTHRVRFEGDGAQMRVRHDVSIRVMMVGITVYRYDLTVRETWDGERLLGLSSTTNKNGTRLSVLARREGSGIRVRRADGGRTVLPGDAIPADPHWNVPSRPHMQMIIAEDGAVRAVSVSGPRRVILTMRGQRFRARRYEVHGEHTATLWYDDDGVLLQKRLLAPDGSTVVTVLTGDTQASEPRRSSE